MVGHVLAGATVILGTLLVTAVGYFAGLVTSPGGIENPVAVIPEFLSLMLMCGAYAVIASTCSFLISVLLQWVRSKWLFPVWLPLIVVPLVTLLVTLPLFEQTRGLPFVELVTGTAVIYFGIYWLVLATSAAVLNYLKRKWPTVRPG